MDETLPGFQALFITFCIAFAGAMFAYIPSWRFGTDAQRMRSGIKNGFLVMLGVIFGAWAQTTAFAFLLHQLDLLGVLEVKNGTVITSMVAIASAITMLLVARWGYNNGVDESY